MSEDETATALGSTLEKGIEAAPDPAKLRERIEHQLKRVKRTTDDVGFEAGFAQELAVMILAVSDLSRQLQYDQKAISNLLDTAQRQAKSLEWIRGTLGGLLGIDLKHRPGGIPTA